MSIAGEIARIQGAKAAMKASINAKGGSLADEKLDAYAAAIDLIETGTDITDATAVQGDILSGKTAYGAAGKLTGTMTNVGAQTAAISAKTGTVTPTQGYHNGSGSISIHVDEQAKIIAGNIKSGITILGVSGNGNVVDTSSGDATAGEILSGKKAYVDGAELTGSMANVGAQSAAISAKAGTVTPTAGYHNGSGSISIDSGEQAKIIAGNIRSGVTILGQAGGSNVIDTTNASDSAVNGDILSGKKAFVNGAARTGSMTNRGAVSGSITTKAGAYTVQAGYHNGSGSVAIASAEQDKIIASNIKAGITILGVTGTVLTNWAGTLTFSGDAATSTYFNEAGCFLAVNPDTGIALLGMKAGSYPFYENICITLESGPSGVSLIGTSPDDYNQHPTGKTFIGVFSGITGKINMAVALDITGSTNDRVYAKVTVTYV